MRYPGWVEPAGMVVGYAADAVFGDPRRAHPVAAFGQLAAALEHVVWADSRARGVSYAVTCVAGAWATGTALRRSTAAHGAARFAVTAASTWAVLGLRGLTGEGATMRALLDSEDLSGARTRLAHLCARDADSLDRAALARASCESLAENASDAVVAPLVWAALAGVPGMLAYRALNTLDAMVGYPTARYRRFGWAVARADDLANLVPARLTAGFAVLAAPVVRGSWVRAWRMYRRDGRNHPSPNAGPVEAAFAGVLDVRLGGTDSYQQVVAQRDTIGDGAAPTTCDIRRAERLTRLVGLLGVGCTAWLRSRLRGGRQRGFLRSGA